MDLQAGTGILEVCASIKQKLFRENEGIGIFQYEARVSGVKRARWDASQGHGGDDGDGGPYLKLN